MEEGDFDEAASCRKRLTLPTKSEKEDTQLGIYLLRFLLSCLMVFFGKDEEKADARDDVNWQVSF